MYPPKSKTKLQKYVEVETWQQRLISGKLEVKTPINMDLEKNTIQIGRYVCMYWSMDQYTITEL